jgi:Prophage antirepressor
MRGPASYIISESGLYKLVMRSDKPEAREFQDWVTREVLPAIRKDGMYVAGEEKVKTGAGLPTYLTTPREPKSCAAATEATIDYPPRRVEEVQSLGNYPFNMEKELGLSAPDIWEMGSSSRVPAVSPSVGLHGSSSLAHEDCQGAFS